MTDCSPSLKVFKSDGGKITELKEIPGGSDGSEKLLQTMIETNLPAIFPGLEFLTSEYAISGLRPDSIAFDTERNSFVIIEYKNVKHKGVVDQGMSYYQLLQEKKGDFVLLYHKVKRRVLDADAGVNWDETRVIFVSREFTEHQKRASGSVDLPIELYEFSKYADGILLLNRIDRKDAAKNGKKPTTQMRIREYSEDDYLKGMYENTPVAEQTRTVYFELKNKILSEFDVEFRQTKKYAGFYSRDGSAICTIEANKNKLRLFYSVRKRGIIPMNTFVEDYSGKGHHGMGDYMSYIQSSSDVEKAMPLIGAVYRFKTS